MVDDDDGDRTTKHERMGFDAGELGLGTADVTGVAPTQVALTPAPAPARVGSARMPSGSRSPMTPRMAGGWESSIEVRASERYKLGPELGKGGMGEVMVAYDEQIGREVAVKRIRAEAPSPEELGRFLREARVQGRLEHPAVVPVYDLASDGDGRPFFVMKRLAGIDMHEVLRRMRSGEEPDERSARRRLLRAFADVCLAIEFAHKRGIIHRDLKPANITLGDFGEVYVLDWGVARTMTDPADSGTRPSVEHDLALPSGETRAGTVLGTPQYMAPEQLVGDAVGPPADIYALGCILFEIAAGEALHPRTRSIRHALSLADARPSQRRSDSPPELDAICLRATAFEPEDRYPSARALGAAVQAFLDGDRDVVVRKELAQTHLGEARAALERGDGEDGRIAALRAAGRALSLDPTATEAADLITSLMLRPPPEVPAEVDQQLAAIDAATARVQGKLASIALLAYLGFVPLLVWTGVRSPLAVVVMVALALAGSIHILISTRRDPISTASVYISAGINALLIAVVCRMVGPLIISPMLVVITLMAYAAHPRFGRVPIVAAILASGVGLPWLLEELGVLAPTYQFSGGGILVHTPIVGFQPVPTLIAFGLLLVLGVSIVGWLLRTVVMRQRDATRRLEVQAWHLRQIVSARGR